MVDDNKDLEYIKEWSAKQKNNCIAQFRKQRDRCRKQLDELKLYQGTREKVKKGHFEESEF